MKDNEAMRLRAGLMALFDSGVVAHDINHLDRVVRNARLIRASEGEGDLLVIVAAAFLHDFHRLLEKRLGRHVPPTEAEPELREFLRGMDEYDPAQVDMVCAAVNHTERYACSGDEIDGHETSIEARIVRDADMLDALGPIGIARAFMFGGYLREPMWAPGAEQASRFVHGQSASVVHHFYEKLFNLKDEMQTRTGRRIAERKTAYMRSFINDLQGDLIGFSEQH